LRQPFHDHFDAHLTSRGQLSHATLPRPYCSNAGYAALVTSVRLGLWLLASSHLARPRGTHVAGEGVTVAIGPAASRCSRTGPVHRSISRNNPAHAFALHGETPGRAPIDDAKPDYYWPVA